MKIIKFTISLFLLAGIFSCSSDDSSEEVSTNDPIIGQWLIHKHFVNGEEVELRDCEAQTGVEFCANGNVTLSDYFEDWDTGECTLEDTTHRWQNLGDEVYKFTHQSGEVREITFTFSNDNNSFTISEEDNSYTALYNRI